MNENGFFLVNDNATKYVSLNKSQEECMYNGSYMIGMPLFGNWVDLTCLYERKY